MLEAWILPASRMTIPNSIITTIARIIITRIVAVTILTNYHHGCSCVFVITIL